MAEERKQNHLDLAFSSQVSLLERDSRFIYEPLMSAADCQQADSITFLGKQLRAPLWVSSLTGGTEGAGKINQDLARLCKDFGLGMGLGSCRSLLESDDFLADFDIRKIIGDDQLLFANLGISQIEQLISRGEQGKVRELIRRLDADGLIIHVNPLQEWFQPEGDQIHVPPILTIERFIEQADYDIIVKEVGQGMGPESLAALMKLPLQAIEFAAFGGTNFSKLELQRRTPEERKQLSPLSRVGEPAERMIESVNRIVNEEKNVLCRQLIISGGLNTFLDGYYLTQKSLLPSIYGYGFQFMKYAMNGYDSLVQFTELQIKGYRMAQSFLRIREDGQER